MKKEGLASSQAEQSRRRLAISITCGGFNVSGGQRVIAQVASALAERHSVRVVVPRTSASPFFPMHDEVVIEPVPTWGPRPLARLLADCQVAWRSLRRADVVLATECRFVYLIWFLRKLFRSRCQLIQLMQHDEPLALVELTDLSPTAKRLRRPIYSLAYRIPMRRIAVSTWVKERVGSPETTVILNGVDVETFTRRESSAVGDSLTVGAVGRSAPWKGFSLFKEAVLRLPAETRTSIRVVVASKEQLDLPEEENWSLLNCADDTELADFYSSCDIFVFSSSAEGFGLPPLEAMAAGAAVISTDCGGVRDFLNEENAVIVSPGDGRQLGTEIEALIHDRPRRERLARKGIETARQLSLSNMEARYLEYFDVLAQSLHPDSGDSASND